MAMMGNPGPSEKTVGGIPKNVRHSGQGMRNGDRQARPWRLQLAGGGCPVGAFRFKAGHCHGKRPASSKLPGFVQNLRRCPGL